MKSKILITLPLLFSLSSCDMEVNLDYVEHLQKSKLVLNSICCSGSDTHAITLGVSRPLFNDLSVSDTLSAPTVTVKHNGVQVPISLESHDGSSAEYKFNAIFIEGDKLEVQASDPGFDDVHGETFFPSMATIRETRTVWYKEDGIDKLRIFAEISDIQGQQNFYRIVIKTKSVIAPQGVEDEPWEIKEIDISSDPIFSDYVGPTSQILPNFYRVFSDRLFADSTYTLDLSINLEPASSWKDLSVVNYLRIELHNLQEPLFKYMYSLSLAHNLDYYSEPVAVYSNINNGFGILGAYSVSFVEMQLDN